MISTKSLYSRVIVAGWGVGASDDYYFADNGGFGGGFAGGNSYCIGKQQNQGAGTQTESSPGPKGSGAQGIAGEFGRCATGLYHKGCSSGGGGGWYGGGSGGYGGSNNGASGGGGSG